MIMTNEELLGTYTLEVAKAVTSSIPLDKGLPRQLADHILTRMDRGHPEDDGE